MDKLFSPWRSKYISSFADKKNEERCVFCDAYSGENDEESLVVYRGKDAFVLMNRFPYNSGHMMVIPARHTADFSSLKISEMMETMDLLRVSERALRELSQPQGFNIGMNLGRVSGAGIDGHLHWHIVPRWNGDTNFMPILSEVKVISEDMAEQWKRLREIFQSMVTSDK
jgi:ATP adenylyltransferase